MKRKITNHKFNNNGKEIAVGICDKSKVDLMYLEFKSFNKRDVIIYLRPDEIVLIAKLLIELILKRVVGYDVNLGRKSKYDY